MFKQINLKPILKYHYTIVHGSSSSTTATEMELLCEKQDHLKEILL